MTKSQSSLAAKPAARRALEQSWMPVAVFALGVMSIGLLFVSNGIHDRFVARDMTLVCAIGQLQTEMAKSHLWMKEYVSGDGTNGDRIWQSLDGARKVTDAILFGGQIHGELQVDHPLKGRALRTRAESIRAQIDEFEQIARERQRGYERGDDVGVGSALDMKHDDLFQGMSAEAKLLEGSIVKRVAENHGRARLLFNFILLAWVMIVGMAVTGLWTRERRRRLAEAALHRSEAQLLQAQKMEAVGRLAGGIAHDINNYLAAITAQCELIRMKSEEASKLARRMDSVIATSSKASALIKRLLAFSRRQPVQPQVVNLNRVVEGLGKMMVQPLGEDVRFETRLSPHLWNVKIDPAQLEQIIVNLLVNAREAMPTGGTVTARTARRVVERDDLHAQPALEKGEYVELSVIDDGTGIAPEIRDKIFEPFFTTKEEAGRSGLGLATVYGIVKQNGGFIELESEVGKGTTFTILLPRCQQAETKAIAQGALKPAQIGGLERILLVEDNDELRDSTQAVLEAMGYRVMVAANGEEALSICDNGGGEFDLLITDVVMPGMSGREVMDRLRERKKDINVIFISGYTDNVILRHGIKEGEFEFLQKPFSADSLASKIRQVMQRRVQPLPA